MKKIIAILLSLGLALSITACEKKGPMEEAGEKIDQKFEDSKDNLSQAKEKIEDTINPKGPAEKAGEKGSSAEFVGRFQGIEA